MPQYCLHLEDDGRGECRVRGHADCGRDLLDGELEDVGADVEPERLAGVVDPELYRNRRDNLVGRS